METILHILIVWVAISIPFSLLAGWFLSISRHPEDPVEQEIRKAEAAEQLKEQRSDRYEQMQL